MIVVSDTSPLTNLAAIGRFHLLRLLYNEIHIPESVWEELNASEQRWPGALEVEQAGWIHRHLAQNQSLVISLLRDLDRGEAEGIAPAIELQADLVLLDEQDGRRAAQRLGLKTIGVLGLLVEAKSRGYLESVRPQLDALRQLAGFYLSDELYQQYDLRSSTAEFAESAEESH